MFTELFLTNTKKHGIIKATNNRRIFTLKKRIIAILAACAIIIVNTGCNSEDELEPLESTATSIINDTTIVATEETAIEEPTKAIVDGLFNPTSIEKLGTTGTQLADYKTIISNYNSEAIVSDDEVKSRIEAEVAGTYIPAISENETVTLGSIANIDYTVKDTDGNILFDKKMESIDVESNAFIPEINSAILNKKAGDTFKVETQYNDKKVTVNGTINFIEGYMEQAVYDERFVEYATKKQCKTKKDYEEFIKNIIISEKNAEIKENILNAIIEGTTFSDKINGEIQRTCSEGEHYFSQYAIDCGYESLDEFVNVIGYTSKEELLEQIKKDAEYYVKKMVVIYAIKEKEDQLGKAKALGENLL